MFGPTRTFRAPLPDSYPRLSLQGIEYLFVSNSDNLGATLDTTLLHYFATSGKAFLMEVWGRTGWMTDGAEKGGMGPVWVVAWGRAVFYQSPSLPVGGQ